MTLFVVWHNVVRKGSRQRARATERERRARVRFHSPPLPARRTTGTACAAAYRPWLWPIWYAQRSQTRTGVE